VKKDPILIFAILVVAIGGFFTYKYIVVNKKLAKEPPKKRGYTLIVEDPVKISEQEFKKGL
jgi:uncharacterized protein YneF (UPF0154 family)